VFKKEVTVLSKPLVCGSVYDLC